MVALLRGSRAPELLLAILSAIALLMLGYVLWRSLLLRPIADDYWIGVSASGGLFPALWGWWQDWSGALTGNFTNTLLVGLPLVWLPWSLASALPFVSAVLSVAALAAWLLIHFSDFGLARVRRRSLTFMILPILMVAWWGYWWVSVLFWPQGQSVSALAQGVTFWQNLNSAAVVPAALMVWAWLYMGTRNITLPLRFSYFIYGLVVGFMSPVVACSALITILFLTFAYWLRGAATLRARSVCWLITSTGIVLAAIANQLSPGTQSRMALLPSPKPTNELVALIALDALPGGISDWVSGITTPGAYALVLLVTGVTALCTRQGWHPKGETLSAVALFLLAFSLVLSVVNRVSELFSYPAYWHLVFPRTAAWLGIVVASAVLGAYIGKFRARSLLFTVASLVACVALVLVGASLFMMTNAIVARWVEWNVGPAPLTYVVDIEDPASTFRASWIDLREIRRDGLQRGLD